jgi:beta-lactam-binding protein with PASTA domain
MTIADATAKVNAAGLDLQEVGSAVNLNCPSTGTATYVAKEVPDAGTQVAKGSVVKVYDSAPASSPSPSPSTSPSVP